MGIQANVKRQEAKLAAQAQAAQAEGQPHSAAPEESNVQPTFDTEALRQIIRTELHAVPQPLGGDEGALQQIVQGAVRTAWQTTPIEPQQVDMEAVRHVIRAEMQEALACQTTQTEQPAFSTKILQQIVRTEVRALPAPQVDLEAIRQEIQTVVHAELCDLSTALQLLIEVIKQQTQAAVVCDDDELLPTAAPRSLDDDDEESREPTTFPARESEEEPVMPPPARSESPIRRLRRPGPDIIALKSTQAPRGGLRRWEPLA